ncbi:IclR family transcriptional regulator [Paeniglutamicibacter antarcticus]|uniref:Glycerol operon regulatory protein n=1 Tax=Arthrobacter terrae TaxID=2935737 RepID=A0A931CTU6_9MICC|nr:IclR family transcriptional regulator [Arthrobacter terrae]MBG0739718.1 IclR family transcriptional regulator [Arthrobacter terrae]
MVADRSPDALPAGLTDPESSSSRGGVQSVDRAITVLEILARTGGAGVSEIADEMGVHKSTASRLLSALDARDMAQQDHERGKYQLGFGILRLASSIPGRLNVAAEARPFLHALADKFQETVNLAVLRSNFAVNVDQAMGPSALATSDWMGSLTPVHATSSGKILLASLDTAERGQILKESGQPALTESTVTSRPALEKQLIAAAANGFATSYSELEIGLNAVAVPVRDHRGVTIAAISISGPAFRFDPKAIPGLLEELKQTGEQVSEKLGYRRR